MAGVFQCIAGPDGGFKSRKRLDMSQHVNQTRKQAPTGDNENGKAQRNPT